MDRELLLEIGVEELPAAWLPALTAELGEQMKTRLREHGFPSTSVETHATPRRLTACVAELVDRQEDRDETVMGPPVTASFDPEGHPTNAALGFARKQNADFDALIQLDTPKGKYLAYQKHIRGRATVDVLPEVLALVLRHLTFPKQMRWDAQLEDGRGEFTFGRPIRWLVFLYGGRVVPFTIGRSAGASSPRVQDISSGAVTYGHRFLASTGRAGRAIKVRTFDEYCKRLTENFVLLSRIERRDRIMRDLEAHARKIGGRAMVNHPQASALLAEVPDLVEFPCVVAGAFSAEFLSLPEEVLTTTLIHHQHFFPVVGANGALMPAFLAITNTQAVNDRAIATNTERVVTARLRDARFFWNADRQAGLESHLDRLATVLFHKHLGSYRDKTARVEALAVWLAGTVFQRPDEVQATARAARLSKADLATDMVREFTELQGTMGGVYAREAGEPEAVWKAVYYHYLPIAVEAEAAPGVQTLGAARVTWACVSLADKLDTLVGLFIAGERPTGSRDPFGLRRAAHGVLRILLDVEVLTGIRARPRMRDLLDRAVEGYAGRAGVGKDEPSKEDGLTALAAFLFERLKFALEVRGADGRNVRTVVSSVSGSLDVPVVDVAANLQALPEFTGSDAFRKLATAFKRVRNIAKELDAGAAAGPALAAVLKDPAEVALLAEIDRRRAMVERAVETGQGYREAYAEASQFEPAVARFFDDVFVMSDDPKLKHARLRLMKQLEQLILQLGDISEIVATES
jgi:glycyl-tRNA synthetase beta chain